MQGNNDIIVTVPPGKCRIVQLIGALPDETVELLYTVSQNSNEHPERFTPLYPAGADEDTDAIAITPLNSPFVLNLPGTYRLVCDTMAVGSLAVSDPTSLGFVGQGDVR